VWRATMFAIGLIAALSGTPLRQAEAASDFARSLAELGEGQVIEMLDGGVGDDSGATILEAGGDTTSPQSTMPPAADGLLTPPPLDPCSPELGRRRGAAWAAPPPTGFLRRHAWLQCFLF
jgi:hypothetical protein